MAELECEGRQEMFHDRHCFTYSSAFSNSDNHLLPTFERWLSFHCPVNPTCFHLRVTLQRASNGGLDCIVFIKRFDDRHLRVDGSFRMTATVPSLGNRVSTIDIDWYDMPPYEEMTETRRLAVIPDDSRYGSVTKISGSKQSWS